MSPSRLTPQRSLRLTVAICCIQNSTLRSRSREIPIIVVTSIDQTQKTQTKQVKQVMVVTHMGALSRAGKTRHLTPHVPKQSEKHKRKTSLRIKCHRSCTAADQDGGEDLHNKPSLSAQDIERRLYIREKRWLLEQKHREPRTKHDTNTKKPFKKHRQPLDEFYYQEFVPQSQSLLQDEEEQVVEPIVESRAMIDDDS